MRRKSLLSVASPAMVSLLWLAGPQAGAQQQHAQPAGRRQVATGSAAGEEELKVGKRDDVEFLGEVRVGEATLRPGTYRIQHRVEGADHYVRFQPLATATPSAHKTATGTDVPAGEAVEVKCRLQPLGAKVQATTLHLLNEAGGRRLARVLIRGENAAHAF